MNTTSRALKWRSIYMRVKFPIVKNSVERSVNAKEVIVQQHCVVVLHTDRKS